MGTLRNLDVLLEDIVGKEGPWPAGAGLRVYKDGECVYDRFLGYRDEEKGLPFTPDTICQLASMTKCIAVTAVMQLYEKGLFLLTDPVEDYIPEFADRQVYDRNGKGELFVRPAKTQMTIGHLFDMTCGMPVNWDRPEPTCQDLLAGTNKLLAEGKYNLREYAKLAGRTPGSFDPGTHYYYGQGHDILAALLEILTGKRFGEYLQENIFEPLGMKDMHFFVPEEKQDRVAVMYALTKEGRKPTRLPDIFYASDFESACGGLFGTIEDYSRFARCMTLGEWNGVRLLNDRTIRLMAMNRLPEDIRKADFENAYHAGYGYGLGLRTRMYPAAGSNTSVGEFGWTGGFGTWVLMDPTAKITIVYGHQGMPNREEYIHPRIRNIVYSAL